MTPKSRSHRYSSVVWVLVVALVLSFSSSTLTAQGDDEDLTFEELQAQRELSAQQIADAAASIDATTASIDELTAAIDDIAALATIHQLRLEEAIERYDSALDRLDLAENSYLEVSAEIDVLRVLVGELAMAQFTGESGREAFEVVLSTDPGQSARLTHLLEVQTGNAQDAIDRLTVLEFEAEELVGEQHAASALAEASLAEMEHRSVELDTAIREQERLLASAELRLATSEADADAAAILLEETEQRLVGYVRGIGVPAPVNRADIVTISFYKGEDATPFFQIQVHKDIEEQTRGLYELAFSQDIDLGGWGYRNTDRQIELRRAHCGATDYDIWLKPAGQCSPPTARPGYSKHEQGRAIDFQWNGGSIGPRSGIPFRWLAANAPQFGFVNLPSEPWHWSDGTANTFDPTGAVPDFPQDAVPETEPDGATIELLNEPLVEALDENGAVDVGGEVAVEVGVELDETESVETDASALIPPEVLGAVESDASVEEAVAGPTPEVDSADEPPDTNETSSANEVSESAPVAEQEQ